MNDKKICFIMCVNDKLYEEECIRYIQKLNVPEGYEVEQLSIWDAPSWQQDTMRECVSPMQNIKSICTRMYLWFTRILFMNF